MRSRLYHVWNTKQVAAKFFSNLLNLQQKQYRVVIAEKMFTKLVDDPDLLKEVITIDKMRVYGQSSQWKFSEELRLKRACQVPSKHLFDCNDYNFLPRGCTVSWTTVFPHFSTIDVLRQKYRHSRQYRKRRSINVSQTGNWVHIIVCEQSKKDNITGNGINIAD